MSHVYCCCTNPSNCCYSQARLSIPSCRLREGQLGVELSSRSPDLDLICQLASITSAGSRIGCFLPGIRRLMSWWIHPRRFAAYWTLGRILSQSLRSFLNVEGLRCCGLPLVAHIYTISEVSQTSAVTTHIYTFVYKRQHAVLESRTWARKAQHLMSISCSTICLLLASSLPSLGTVLRNEKNR